MVSSSLNILELWLASSALRYLRLSIFLTPLRVHLLLFSVFWFSSFLVGYERELSHERAKITLPPAP